MPLLQKAIRHVQKIHQPSGRTIVSTVRNLRNFDKVYNTVVNPISFCEITWDDLGDMLPVDEVMSHIAKLTPCRDICELYDTFTSDKDIVECFVSMYLKVCKFEKMDTKQKSMLVMKGYCLAYKLYWIALACCGVPKAHETFVCFLDYFNFIISTICDL
jgi:hypothetical protein